MELLNHLELSISPNQVRPTLRALLHGIFFHRILDLVEPDTYEINDAHVAVYPTSTVEREVNTKIEEFVRETVDKGKERGEIAVVFLQRRPRKGWFAVTEELIPWEEHLITLHFPRTSSRNYKPPSTNALPLALLQLLNFCADKKNNVPPLTGTSEAKNAGLGDSYQILISPPPPEEIFSPSPPTHPTRLTSPPPGPSLTTTPATALARDMTLPASSAADEAREVGRASNPAGISYGYGAQGHGGPAAQGVSGQGVSVGGYFEQAKDGLRAVGARAGAVAGWTGRTGQSRGN